MQYVVTYKLKGETQRRTAQVVDNQVPAMIVAEAFQRKHNAEVIRCQMIGHAAQLADESDRLWQRRRLEVVK